MENFYIRLGKTMARNDQTIRVLTNVVKANRKTIGLLVLSGGLLWLYSIDNSRQITKLKKEVANLHYEIDALKGKDKTEDEILEDLLK